ncbi:MAG: hypothetical protein E7122_05100 [Bacteroidales bacterium]|nr:hypothetical protein [Bacteroidales bacterium]
MIKKMTKYSFVVFHKEVEDFLKNLQEIGVVDVTRQKRAIDSYSMEKFEEIAQYNAAVNNLGKIREEALKNKHTIPSGKPAVEDLLGHYKEMIALKESLKGKIYALKGEYSAALPWGTFTKKNFEELYALGFKPFFYCVSAQRYEKEWEELYPIHIFNKYEGKIYFAILMEGENKPEIKLQEAAFPDIPADLLGAELKACEEKAEWAADELLALTNCIDELKQQKEELFCNLDLYLANEGSQKKADETIVIFEAFAPTDIDNKVVEFLESNNVYYLMEAAKVEDNPPIKLKNNFFAKLYEPIGDLYMLPKYGELDLTVFFAPFYMLFFGLCLGDMGYGLVLIITGLIVNFKVKAFANYGKLIAWLGLGAVIMPALNGTVFGAKIYELVPMPQNITDLLFNDMQMFWFAILFGIFQIIFARGIQAVYCLVKKNYNAALSGFGWMIGIAWATLAYASMEAGFTYPAWINYIAMAGLVLILFFSSNARNPFVRLFKGVTSLYDSTGVFGDVLSYIRLFGLGTSGGILGFVVNSIAMNLAEIPYAGWLLMGIMLVVGHIFVLLLSCLGAFVHPLRLTFIEFYKNAGFEGGGRAYNPLRKENNN